MKIAIIGATGNVGSRLFDEAVLDKLATEPSMYGLRFAAERTRVTQEELATHTR